MTLCKVTVIAQNKSNLLLTIYFLKHEYYYLQLIRFTQIGNYIQQIIGSSRLRVLLAWDLKIET
jgi:hypothetical protein